MEKISFCAADLKAWNDEEFGRKFRELRKKRKKLKDLNKGNLNAAQLANRRKIVRDIADLLHHEELYWRQRSRAIWLF